MRKTQVALLIILLLAVSLACFDGSETKCVTGCTSACEELHRDNGNLADRCRPDCEAVCAERWAK